MCARSIFSPSLSNGFICYKSRIHFTLSSSQQALAGQTGRKLVVQNLSLQTDGADLIGGYRPGMSVVLVFVSMQQRPAYMYDGPPTHPLISHTPQINSKHTQWSSPNRRGGSMGRCSRPSRPSSPGERTRGSSR